MRTLNRIAKARGQDKPRHAPHQQTDSLLDLQRTAGNRAVRRLLRFEKGDEEEEAEQPLSAASPQESQAPRQKPPRAEPEPPAPAEASRGNVAGTIPNVVTPPEEARSTSHEGEQAEGPEEELAPASPSPDSRGNVVADLQLNFSQPKVEGFVGGKHDSVTAGVAAGSFSRPNTKVVKTVFGSEDYKPAFSDIAYTFSGGVCNITAKLDVICPWGTNSLGRRDVPSATAAVVTKRSWPSIKRDLEPSSKSPHKSRRKRYYSKALVERHEKFHGKDDNDWTQASGLQIVKQRLEKGVVFPLTAARGVKRLLNSARRKLIRENWKWYKGGGSAHDSYAGEIRAYADGRPEYQKLADDVEAHGKSLP